MIKMLNLLNIDRQNDYNLDVCNFPSKIVVIICKVCVLNKLFM